MIRTMISIVIIILMTIIRRSDRSSLSCPAPSPRLRRSALSIHQLRIWISGGWTQADSEFEGVEFPGSRGVSKKFGVKKFGVKFAD